MKLDNLHRPGERAVSVTRGHIGVRRAGSNGINLVDQASTSADEVTDIELVGMTVYDLGDGTAQIVNDATVADGGEPVGSFGGGTGLSSDGMVPFYVPADATFTVPLYKQALFYEPIEVDGGLIVVGLLQGVD